VVASPDASGQFPKTLGGVQVSINSIAAPLLYVGPNQINFQVPLEPNPGGTFMPDLVRVMLPGGTIVLTIPPSPALGLFAPILNQDGTVNSAANPAVSGSIVTLFGTGAPYLSGFADGAIATVAVPLSQESNQLQLIDDAATPLNSLYAGTAPGLIDGVFQINAQLPKGAITYLPLGLTLKSPAAASSNRVLVYTK
jgi:uncharacterized protein (TIGR03437 family)